VCLWRPMAGTVEHPDIRYVVYPVHLDGTRTGAKPRLRHDPDCGHFEWRDGTVLGTPELATEEQMQTLRACKTCIETHTESPRDARRGLKDGRIGEVCAACNQVMPLTGICDNCVQLPTTLDSRGTVRNRLAEDFRSAAEEYARSEHQFGCCRLRSALFMRLCAALDGARH
jgi:hypothetical protein